MIVGDTHGVTRDIVNACNEAGKRKIAHLLVVGDWGGWEKGADGIEFVDSANEAAKANNLSIYVIRGNHDDTDTWNYYLSTRPTHKGFAMARRRVLYAPEAHKWTWAGKQFVGAGGAISIDRAWRLAAESGNEYDFFEQRVVYTASRKPKRPRTLYWPDEALQEESVKAIESWNVKADYLFSHDCSDYTPFRDRLKPDPESKENRQRIDRVLRATKPEMHWHGHMHTRYDWVNGMVYGNSVFGTSESVGHSTQTYGLECNNSPDAWGVLDTDTNKFTFATDMK